MDGNATIPKVLTMQLKSLSETRSETLFGQSSRYYIYPNNSDSRDVAFDNRYVYGLMRCYNKRNDL